MDWDVDCVVPVPVGSPMPARDKFVCIAACIPRMSPPPPPPSPPPPPPLCLHIPIGLAAQADGLGCGLRGPCA